MAAFLGFLTKDGVLIGAIGETSAEAIDQLADEYGDDVASLWAKAGAELYDRVRAVPSAPRLDAPGGPASGVPRGADSSQTGPATPATDQVSGQGDSVARGDQGPSAATEESTAEADSDTSPPFECAICGAGITAGRAELSMDEFGEYLCKKCGL